jgi:hypothetical protein
VVNQNGRKRKRSVEQQFSLPLPDLHAEYVQMIALEEFQAEGLEETQPALSIENHEVELEAEATFIEEPPAVEIESPSVVEPEVAVTRVVDEKPSHFRRRAGVLTSMSAALACAFLSLSHSTTTPIPLPPAGEGDLAPRRVSDGGAKSGEGSAVCLHVSPSPDFSEEKSPSPASERGIVQREVKRSVAIPLVVADKVPSTRRLIDQGRDALKSRDSTKAVTLLAKARATLMRSASSEVGDLIVETNRLYTNALYLQAFDALQKQNHCLAKTLLSKALQISPTDEKIVQKAHELSQLAGC